MKAGSRSSSFFRRKNLTTNIGKPIAKMMITMAMAKSTLPSAWVKSTFSREVYAAIQFTRKVCISARSKELNMSLARIMLTNFWKHVQHLGRTFILQKTSNAMRNTTKTKTSKSCST